MKKTLSFILVFLLMTTCLSSYAASEKMDVDLAQSKVIHNGVEYDLSTLEGASKYFSKMETSICEEEIDMLELNRCIKSFSSIINTDVTVARTCTYDLETKLRNNATLLNVIYETLYTAELQLTGDPIKAAAIAYISTAIVFADNVKIGGTWDFKQELGWNTYYNTKINGGIYYLPGEDIGNIHYGFVGRTLFPASILKRAAGLVQIIGGDYKVEWYSTYFDDPNDQIAIQRGIDYFNTGVFN